LLSLQLNNYDNKEILPKQALGELVVWFEWRVL